MQTPRIAVIGAVNMDIIIHMQKMPAVSETVTDPKGGVAYLPGGRAGNCAVALTRLGAYACLCARLGGDLHGQRMYAAYREAGIDTSAVMVDQHLPSGITAVILDADGSRLISFPGANAAMTSENLSAAFATLPDAVCMQLDLPFSMVQETALMAAERQIPIILDAAPTRPVSVFGSLPVLEIFSSNEEETYAYTGIRPTGTESCLKAALALMKVVRARYYVLKLGDRGAYVFDGRHFHMTAAYHVQVVDTAAVGDIFMSALTYDYLRNGGQIVPACKFAHAASAVSVTRPGGASSAPTLSEVNAFISKNGLR